MSNLYLNQHFTSDGHSEEDIDQLKKLHVHLTLVYVLNGWREKTIGVGNSVQFIPMVLMTMSGNVSKCAADMVVGTLFNKQPRKFRKRPLCKHKRKVAMTDLTGWVDTLFSNYKSCDFCFNFRCFVLGLPKKCMMMLSTIIDNWVASP